MDNIMFVVSMAGITFILYYFCALFWGSLQDIKRKKKKEKEKEEENKENQNKESELSDDEIHERFKNSKSLCTNCKHVRFVKYIKETNTFGFYTDCSYPKGEDLPIYCKDFEEREN